MILISLLLIVLIVLFIGASRKFYTTAKQAKMSKWAKANKTHARLLLFGFNLGMALTGVSIGLLCSQLNLRLDESAIYAGLGIFLVGTIFFPSNKRAGLEMVGRYKRKQTMLFLRLGGSSLAVIATANVYLMGSGTSVVTEAAIAPVVLIILATLGLLIFGAAILVLSCGIACSGHEVAAVLVLFTGGTGLIVLYIFVLRAINRRAKLNRGIRSPEDASVDSLDDTFVNP